MKFVTKQLEIEAEVIVKVEPIVSTTKGSYEVWTSTGRVIETVSSQPIEKGDYLNVTNLDDIYHMPKHIVDGPNAKYESAMSSMASCKTLDNENVGMVKKQVSDVKVVGNGDMFQLLCKASSKSQGWMKSCKAMPILYGGCVVQVTTQQGDHVAEALTYVPNVIIMDDINGGRRLIKVGCEPTEQKK